MLATEDVACAACVASGLWSWATLRSIVVVGPFIAFYPSPSPSSHWSRLCRRCRRSLVYCISIRIRSKKSRSLQLARVPSKHLSFMCWFPFPVLLIYVPVLAVQVFAPLGHRLCFLGNCKPIFSYFVSLPRPQTHTHTHWLHWLIDVGKTTSMPHSIR